MDAQNNEKHYTYADYYTWDDDKRYELIDGIVYVMSPAPYQAHQMIIGRLFRIISDFLDDKPFQIFMAPFDVRLNAESGDDTVLQPDLMVICDNSKLDGKACVGAPDIVIEVLSKSTAHRDRLEKFRLYEKAGVKEYLIVDNDNLTIHAHILENSRYYTQVYGDGDKLHMHVLEGCVINLSDVFVTTGDGTILST